MKWPMPFATKKAPSAPAITAAIHSPYFFAAAAMVDSTTPA
jgi:hypothetical protein